MKKDIEDIVGEKVFQFFTEDIEKYGLTFRDGQLDMACEIVDGMKKNLPGIIEAGVGIGKSYAYLVPLLYSAKYFNKTMVISTSTIVLQNQLLKNALKVSEMLNIDVPIYNLKGQTNYICHKRLARYKQEFPAFMTDDIFKTLLKCNTQDVAKSLSQYTESMWDLIDINKYGKTCSKDSCKYSETCIYNTLRGNVRQAGGKIIICNHDVLIADLKAKHYGHSRIIDNDIYAIVVDEAHHIEDKVRTAFTKEFNVSNLNRCIVALSSNSTQENEVGIIQAYIDKLHREIKKQISFNMNDDECTRLFFDAPLPNDNVINALNSLYIEHTMIHTQTKKDISALYENCINFLNAIKNDKYLTWIDISQKIPIVCYAPKNIASISNELFFKNESKRVFFTSGTITDSDSFSGYKYFAKAIGFPLKGILYEQKASPFDSKNVQLFIPKDMDIHKDSEYKEKAIRYINNLVNNNHGNTLILFTSVKDMKYVEQHINTKYPIYVQTGKDDAALQNFKKQKNSILLSTNVWEGFDVQGEKLSQVIIYKLPFAVPDPVITEKCDHVLDKMYGVLFPNMIIKLKQGCGRLIRSEFDSGIISILDSRAITGKDYSEEILKALPYKNITTDINNLHF